jgi:putative membrane protein
VRGASSATVARMMVTTRGSVLRIFVWQWRKALFFAAAAAAVTAAHKLYSIHDVLIPTTPVLVVGAAISIFISFRANSAYDRWWEGRKLWGLLVNTSRHFSSQALVYLRDPALARALIVRHAGYVHVLRCSLRGEDPWEDARVRALLSAEAREGLRGESNPAHALLHQQAAALAAAADRGELDGLRLQSFDASLAKLLDIQGGCERIKKTPLPRGYAFIAERLIMAYGALFPLSMADELGWGMIPINVLVGMSFAMISETGRVLEDPFTTFWNGLPLSQLSTMIEVNIRQRAGDDDLPVVPTVNADGVLM